MVASTRPAAAANKHSVNSNVEVIEGGHLANEVRLGRVAGPMEVKGWPMGQISLFGVIPKSQQPQKWRLIIDLPHPQSINDGIEPEVSTEAHISR